MAQPTLSDVHIQTALTDLSIGYRQDRPSFVERLFPRVVVSKQSDKYYIWDKGQMWRRSIRKKRAPGAAFDRAGLTLSTDSYISEQYPLEYPLPDEVIANQDAAVDVEMAATDWLYDQTMLEMEYQWATAYMTTSAGWGSGTKTAKWSTTSTPVKDVAGAVRTIRSSLGASASHRFVGLGGTIVETALIGNADIAGRIQYVQRAGAADIRAALAAVLGLDDLIIADRVYNTAKEGATASYSNVIDDDFLIVAVPNSPGLMTPAAGYTFCWDEGGRGDMYIERYRDETIKSDILRSITYWGFEQTGAALGVLFDDVTD